MDCIDLVECATSDSERRVRIGVLSATQLDHGQVIQRE